MITEEMMMTTEMLLMSYYFDMSEWLKGIKTVNVDILQKNYKLSQLLMLYLII